MNDATRPNHRILVVDDLVAIHEDFRKILAPIKATADFEAAAAALFGEDALAGDTTAGRSEFTIDSAFQGEEALELVKKAEAAGKPYALAFVDVRMPPGWDGLETIRRVWEVAPDLQVVLCTAHSDYTWSETNKALGRSPNLIVLKKPFDNTEVLQLAHALTRKWQLSRDSVAQLASLDGLVRQRTQQLRQAEETFAQAFAANPHAQAIIALDRVELIAVNAAFESAFGLRQSDIAGTTPENFGRGIDSNRLRRLLALLKTGEAVKDHAFVYQPDAVTRRDMSSSARPVNIGGRPCAIWVIEDVTDRLHLEAQLRQAQKLEAIGQLAAGIAHDFNNLLTVVQCYTSELLADPANAHLKSSIEPAHAAALRAATLTRQLLVFSRKQITQMSEFDVTAILRDIQPFLSRLIGENVNLQWEIADKLPTIRGDRAAIEQIVVNLVVNARDAVPSGGSVKLSLSSREFGSAAEANHAEATAGRFVTIEVSDNGSGIPPNVLPRIFEPFFTTKEVGKGTGLGLSTVYSLVRQHEGWIDVKTAIGQGTTFTVYLPALATAAGPDEARPARRRLPIDLPHIRILAVEDDPIIQKMLRSIFKRANVPCTLASDAASAIEEWKRSGPFELLITDVVMPNGFSGVDLARELRGRAPKLPVIFMTGYCPEDVAATSSVPGPTPRIMEKPFTIESLTETIFEALKPAAG